MVNIVSDPNIPRYVYICGIAGLTSLGIALACFLIFFFAYEEKIDLSIEEINFNKRSTGYKLTGGLSLGFTILGILLSFFIIYGHIIKQKNDPQAVFGPSSYMELPHRDEHVQIEKETSNIYTGRSLEIPENNRYLNTDFL